jgi:hypothetical protein
MVNHESAPDRKAAQCVGHRLMAAPPRPVLGKANHLTGHFPAKQSRKRLVDLFQ